MAINLHDIPVAVKAYLASSVPVTVTITPNNGTEINPGETFKVRVDVHNNGNVDLAKVRYQVTVDDPSIAKVAPPLSSNFGQGFVYPSSQDAGTLAAGQAGQINFDGHAGSGTGSTKIEVRISAEPDLDRVGPFVSGTVVVKPST